MIRINLILLVSIVLSGCASTSQFSAAEKSASGLDIVATHCSAYGPFKTTRATKDTKPKIAIGAAVVCEK